MICDFCGKRANRITAKSKNESKSELLFVDNQKKSKQIYKKKSNESSRPVTKFKNQHFFLTI